MKKVKKVDLVRLIAQYYCNFIRLTPVDDIINGNSDISINVDTVYISVLDRNEFDSETDQNAYLQNFAEQIEAITFGNLKVTYMGCKMNPHLTWMCIANAYEFIED